ncbi:MAG: cytochrome P450 [Burkholderiaceae bacterium]
MPDMPCTGGIDSTLAFVADGYLFISKRCERFGADVFRTRLLMQPAICMRGAEAARLFYDTERFRRHGATPERAQKTLFGVGGVQSLDQAAHRQRKAMFLALMTPARLQTLVRIFDAEWDNAIGRWQTNAQIALFEEAQLVLCRAVCRWAGVPLPDREAPRIARLLGAVIDSAGGVGARYWHGRVARVILERWLARLVEQVRAGALRVDADAALYAIATHREQGDHGNQDDHGDRPLDPRVAAVEVINVLRPTVAIARYIVFAAVALHANPDYRSRIAQEEGKYEDDTIDCFVQEVRRFYPFFPAVAARACKTFDWHGMRFPRGTRVLLDLYGTDHDARLWPRPERFDPERFRGLRIDAYELLAQGGGDHYRNHRCAGEWLTIDLMQAAVRGLVQRMRYTVPPQDLSISLQRMPTLPRSRFLMRDVERLA